MAAKPKDDDRAALRQARHAVEHARPTLAPPPAAFSLAEVRRLIALMDSSDLTEISIEHADMNMRLVLRRVVEVIGGTPADAVIQASLAGGMPTSLAAPSAAPEDPVVRERVFVTAPIVGIFFPALNPAHKPLVQVGDLVREGQLVGGIETLNVMNEVESQVTGRVDEILVEPGQPVEYGQHLIALIPE
jgi:acetyl-CoA carboxylase biotin carboxyl carrier protein